MNERNDEIIYDLKKCKEENKKLKGIINKRKVTYVDVGELTELQARKLIKELKEKMNNI